MGHAEAAARVLLHQDEASIEIDVACDANGECKFLLAQVAEPSAML